MLFAEKIKSLREERKLLQRELAAALDIDVPMYSRIERGERPVKREQIKLIADILEYDERELLKLWLADQVSAVLDGDNEIINDVLDIAKSDMNRMKNKKNKYSFIDLFAGIGGFHQAMHSVGMECVFASELESVLKCLKIFVSDNLNECKLHHCFSRVCEELIVNGKPSEVLQPSE